MGLALERSVISLVDLLRDGGGGEARKLDLREQFLLIL